MKKVRWEITNNFKAGADYVEYDKDTFECTNDDIWVNVEIPMTENTEPQAKN